jgi:hypothetical protein
MPRRIQDYPYGYSGWHSVASLGHIFVLLGIISFGCVLAHAIYFKRPLMARHLGMPFVVSRFAFLVLDKQYAAKSQLGKQVVGIKDVRLYLQTFIG